MGITGSARYVGDQGGGASAFANQQALILIEVVFLDQAVDHGDDLVGRAVEDLTRGGLEYLETISTRFDDREQERMIKIYREVETHLRDRAERGA